MHPILEEIEQLLSLGHKERYGAERVSQLEHALQCATLAEQAGSSPELITACLLHDIGHLRGHLKEETALEQNVDLRHEESGANFLETWFSPAVSQPVRLHVQAKRYLCQAEPGYWDILSEISKHTLELQGGVFSAEEAAGFIAQPHAGDSVQLRRWDDEAKEVGLETPDLEHFRQYLLVCVKNEE